MVGTLTGRLRPALSQTGQLEQFQRLQQLQQLQEGIHGGVDFAQAELTEDGRLCVVKVTL